MAQMQCVPVRAGSQANAVHCVVAKRVMTEQWDQVALELAVARMTLREVAAPDTLEEVVVEPAYKTITEAVGVADTHLVTKCFQATPAQSFVLSVASQLDTEVAEKAMRLTERCSMAKMDL